MKGYKVTKSFYHGKQYYIGDEIDVGDFANKELEKRDLIRWVERPEIIMPKKKDKPKVKRKNVSKSKRNI